MKKNTIAEYIRYLAAKKVIDNSSMNEEVWQQVKENIPHPSAEVPLTVVELGGGIGTMLERMVEWRLASRMRYVFTEPQKEYVNHFWVRLEKWCQIQSGRFQRTDQDQALLALPGSIIELAVLPADAETVLTGRHEKVGNGVDLLLAHAVLDLLDIEKLLPGCFRLLKPSGLFYATIVYNGHTTFRPDWHNGQEKDLLDRYHASMNRLTKNGRSTNAGKAGTTLLSCIAEQQHTVVSRGSSDWQISPVQKGYSPEQFLFLQAILNTIAQQLILDWQEGRQQVRDWLTIRRRQLALGELCYTASNIDVLASSAR